MRILNKRMKALVLCSMIAMTYGCGTADENEAPKKKSEQMEDSNGQQADTMTDEDKMKMEKTIVDLAIETESLSILKDLVIEAGLADALSDKEATLTVFAPTNEAFAKIEAVLGTLTQEQKTEILKYHVLGSTVFSSDLQAEQEVATLSNEKISITANEMGVQINGMDGAKVSQADIKASNGVIHVIDTVLLPEAYRSSDSSDEMEPEAAAKNIVELAIATESLSTLKDLVVEAGLAEALSDENSSLTVFAPTNDAFAKIEAVLGTLTQEQKTEILKYHVLASKVLSTDLAAKQAVETLLGEKVFITADESGVKINGTPGGSVTAANIEASNGVVHLIDTVLLPEAFMDIPSALQKRYSFGTLLTAITTAELVETLQGEGPFTLFAPNDAAFSKIDSATLNGLIADKPALTNVLLTHVVSGSFEAAEVLNTSSFTAVSNESLSISLQNDLPYIESSQIIETDIKTSNGVIHVIDTVIVK